MYPTKEIIQYQRFNKGKEIGGTSTDLLFSAVDAAKNAYAPYSKFYVGAALLLENGIIIPGCNQENASYPCGICAERVALYTKGAQFPKEKIIKLAVTVITPEEGHNEPASPCGLCRQVMTEFEINNKSDIELIVGHPENTTYIYQKIRDILNFGFSAENLVSR